MRFSIDTRESHGEAIIHIAKYLKETRDKEITMNPKIDKSFEAYVNASFSGEQIKESAAHNPGTAKKEIGLHSDATRVSTYLLFKATNAGYSVDYRYLIRCYITIITQYYHHHRAAKGAEGERIYEY